MCFLEAWVHIISVFSVSYCLVSFRFVLCTFELFFLYIYNFNFVCFNSFCFVHNLICFLEAWVHIVISVFLSFLFFVSFCFVKVTWHTAKYGEPYLEVVLCIYPSKVHTHTAVNTHIVNTHSNGQPFMLRRLGSSWGFGALLKGTSVRVLRVERALYIKFYPPTIPASPRLELATFGLRVRLSNH